MTVNERTSIKMFTICILLLGWVSYCLTEKAPHIVIILADDLGHDDVSFLGSKQIPTPNLDSLAYDGIILDNYYVQRICTPSRAALMTGRHPIQLGLQKGVILGSEKYGLGLNETLMPEYLKKLGYQTHIIGKWHLGFFAKEYTPTYRGFDSFFGFYQGHSDYYDHTFVNYEKGAKAWGLDLRNNTEIVKTEFGRYATEIFTREAVNRINNHDTSKPMLMYFPQQGVHAGNEITPTPLEAPWKYVKKFSHIADKQRRIYAGMVSAVDDSVGQIIKALHARNMLNDTIIFFSTDNGGPAHGYDMNEACNWPLRGMKYTLWEGGVRGASFIWSPRFKQSGYVSKHMIQIEDIFPTLLHGAGYNTSVLPSYLYGMDFWDVLSENKAGIRQVMLHNVEDSAAVKAVRVGDMKIITSGKHGQTALHDGWYGPPQITDDRSEDNSDPEMQIVGVTSEVQSEKEHDMSLDIMNKFRTINVREVKNYLNNPAPAEMFKSDIPHILKSLGRPERRAKPVITNCGPKPANQTTVCKVADHPCLFNVTADPCEYNNLATTYPHIFTELLAKIKDFDSQAVPPRNEPDDPAGDPKYHGGVWGPWVNLSQEELIEMRQGKVEL